jgi:cytochrome c2
MAGYWTLEYLSVDGLCFSCRVNEGGGRALSMPKFLMAWGRKAGGADLYLYSLYYRLTAAEQSCWVMLRENPHYLDAFGIWPVAGKPTLP